jgi:cell division protein ZapD
MIENATIYEQPLNETLRVCLRLEQLFAQLDHQASDDSISGTRNVVSVIINILQLLDRPDLKAKLAKELTSQSALLVRLENTPEIDQNKLSGILKQLDELSRVFIDSSGKIGQPLREIELLNNLRLHLTSPGGGCSFDIPVYYYWLHQPIEKRKQTIQSWLTEFNNIRLAISLLLQLTREGSKVQKRNAEQGFYQELLDPQTNLRLIRVAIPNGFPAYPEISVGRHFLSIRFFSPTIHERPTQYMHNFEFWLSYCSL